MTTVLVYPNPPIEAGYPTAADPPLAGPMPAVLEDEYTSQMIHEGGFLTAPRDSYSTAPKTGTATSTIGLVITLNYSATFYEVVYQLGAFTPLYAAGSTVNLGTGAYSIIRTGGFPPGVTVNAIGCTPCPPMPTSGQALGTIYEVDFRTLSSQTFGVAGSYVVDGKTWWAKGALSPVVMTSTIQPGVGMVLTCTSAHNLGNSGPYTNRAMYLPLANVPNYNPAAPVVVRARLQRSMPAGGACLAWLGLVNTPQSAADYTQRTLEIFCGQSGFDPTSSVNIKRLAAGNGNLSAGQPNVAESLYIHSIWEMFPGYRSAGTQLWDGVGAFPAMAVVPVPSLDCAPTSNVDKTICFAMSDSSGSASVRSAIMTHLSISQPRVP